MNNLIVTLTPYNSYNVKPSYKIRKISKVCKKAFALKRNDRVVLRGQLFCYIKEGRK